MNRNSARSASAARKNLPSPALPAAAKNRRGLLGAVMVLAVAVCPARAGEEPPAVNPFSPRPPEPPAVNPFGSPASEPPAINPFGPRPREREDALPGYVELSDGSVFPGRVYLTRDVRLRIYDEALQRQREVPLRVIKRIECKVKREWMEKEWRFKQAASAEKVYTGREYPAREYVHVITLHDDRTIEGPLSGVVYVQPYMSSPGEQSPYRPGPQPRKFLLHKRDKGPVGSELKSLVYVKVIELGEEALSEGRRKAGARRRPSAEGSPAPAPQP